MSRKLCISKTPIREAFKRLESESLIQILPRRGTYVSTYGIEDINEIYYIREILEGLAARLASQILNEDDFVRLHILVEKANQAALAKEIIEFSYFDSSFHLMFVQKCGSNRLMKIYGNIYDLVQIVRLQFLHLPLENTRLYKEHLDIISALESRSPDQAEEVVRRHLRRVKDGIMDKIKK